MDKSLRNRLEGLKGKTWELARESLDQGEIEVYRLLIDMTERLTGLFLNDDSPVVQSVDGLSSEHTAVQQPIFAKYKTQNLDAEVSVSRIRGGRFACVRFKGKWQTPSAAAMSVTNTNVNGWRFWKYYRTDGTVGLIDELRK